MDTAPGSEPLAKPRGDARTAEAARAGPCDPQDPPPCVPDDTPPDERPAPRRGSAAEAVPRGTAAATPGAHEVTIDPDIAHGHSAHDTTPRPTAQQALPGEADGNAAEGGGGADGAARPVAKTTGPRG